MNSSSKNIFTIACLFFISLSSFAGAIIDSVGVKSVDNKKYIVYKVGAKEGWFGIAKKYNLSTGELQQANPKAGKDLKKGEEILIPQAEVVVNNNTQQATIIKEPIYYDVKKKETLYSIAKSNNTVPDSLKKWNNISSKKVKSGERLIVGYTIKVIEPPKPKPDTLIEKVKLTPSPATKAKAKADSTKKNIVPPKPKHPVSEQGVAAWIGDKDEVSNMYYALHRTAPTGTIIKVTNKMNKKYVFVKVLGVLPGTGDNNDLIIKISKSSAEKLDVRDKRFQCQLDYSVTD